MSIDDLVFSDAVPLESKEDEAPVNGADLPPVTDTDLHCEVCGTTLSYSGRGRKPKRCSEHKRGGGSKGSVSRRATPNDKLASQATDALIQINRLTGLGTRIIGLPGTSEAIMFCEDAFREQAYQALLTDPSLCKQILSAGQVSAKFSLAIAYAMMGATVVPVAAMEIKAKREAKRDKEAEEIETDNDRV